MIDRRKFMAGVGGAIALPVAVGAQTTPRRLAVLTFGTPNDPISRAHLDALRDGLAKLGWIEDKTLIIDFRAASDSPGIHSAAAELIARAPDVIVSRSTVVTKALLDATKTIPIVFLGAGDPITGGLVASLARPGGNVTGITDVYFTIGGKWLEMLKEAAPSLKRFGILFNPDLTSSTYFPSMEAAAAQFDVETVMLPARSQAEIEQRIVQLAAEPDGGLVMLPPAPVRAAREVVRALAVKYRLPTIYQNKYYVIEGGMMSYGPDGDDLFRNRGPAYVDRILHGAKPAAMPVQFATKFELAFNLRTVEAIGLDIPRALFARADAKID